jgi:gamma-glutamyltranspeptidase/glutathione hydrolase
LVIGCPSVGAVDDDAARFARGVVATPHHLASAVGAEVLAQGGNALDAAIAANLALGVVAPYFCGPGGDLFAIVWDGDLHGYLGAGRAPMGVTADAVAARHDGRMPFFGGDSVTVPGAVRGWFDLLERWGTRSFGDLAAGARRLALDGFTVSAHGAASFAEGQVWYAAMAPWVAQYGAVRAGTHFRQPASARLLDRLAADGPDAFFRGAVAEAVVAAVWEAGGELAAADLAAHVGEWCAPLTATYRGTMVAELPPPTQGVTVLEALRVLDGLDLPADPVARTHLLVEAVKLALVDRDTHVGDPPAMTIPGDALLDDAYVAARRAALDPVRASDPPPGRPQRGGTAYLCAADADGLLVSLIQSNFAGFGSGVFVPDWGINLHNRGASFCLDPIRVNVFAPGKRPLHTLIPALALRDGRPWTVFGTMGGDAQAQVHVQLVSRMVDDGDDPATAIAAPRWRVDPGTWRLHLESRNPDALVTGLRARGHRTARAPALDSAMGHAHAIRLGPGGYHAGSDPRAEGAARGV